MKKKTAWRYQKHAPVKKKKVSPSSQSNNFCWRLLLGASNENGTADESKDVTIRKEEILDSGAVTRESYNYECFSIRWNQASWLNVELYFMFSNVSRRWKRREEKQKANKSSALTNGKFPWLGLSFLCVRSRYLLYLESLERAQGTYDDDMASFLFSSKQTENRQTVPSVWWFLSKTT